MRRRYITGQILMACLAKPGRNEKNIYQQLEETLAERRWIVSQWEKSFLGSRKKDIHALLDATIAERKKLISQWEKIFSAQEKEIFEITDIKAA